MEIHSSKTVKAYIYGDTLEMTTANGIHEKTIRVLPNKHYVDLKTGEIHKMNTSNETRFDNLKTVKQTMKKLRRLVANNFTGGKNQLWITLTYREHVTRPNVVYKDFKAFMRRVRESQGHVEYIAVIEPQESGRWHLHVLMKNETKLMIPNADLEKLWKKGFTKTKRLRKADKIGNYLIAYLSNLKIETGTGKKAIVKGMRLNLYPKGLRIYRASRGIKRPIEITTEKHMIVNSYNISRSADYTRVTNHKTKEGKTVKYITEFYDNIHKIE